MERRKKAAGKVKTGGKTKTSLQTNSTTSEQDVKINVGADWVTVADGVSMRIQPLDEYRLQNPDVNYILPVDAQTELNGMRLSFEQLGVVWGFFGQSVTLQNIQLWLEKQNLKIERLNWLHILELIGESGGKATPKPVQAERRKLKRKLPQTFHREALEQYAAAELAKNPGITAEALGQLLRCNKSTVVRLKAWEKRGALDYPKPAKGFVTQDEDGVRTGVEPIDDGD